ncbi:MAG: diguanylate cyclase [Candidatus Izemoplasmatales bacterium]|nr:diguanylate cyclase [Candidatus Izemoplasmatales bacterium]
MNPEIIQIFVQLLSNSLLLFASSFIYGASNISPTQDKTIRKIALGVILGSFSIVIMFNAIRFDVGVIYDTRTVLLSVVAAFFPTVTALVAAFMALIYRYFFVAGGGIYAGSLSIVSATLIGFIWKRYAKKIRIPYFLKLYFLGLLASIFMIASQLALPISIRFQTISKIALPVIFLYPLLTMFVAISIKHQMDRLESISQMRTLQSLMKASLDSPENTSIFALNNKFEYLFFNKFHHDFMLLHDNVEVYPGLNLIQQIKDPLDQEETKNLYLKALYGESFTIQRHFMLDGVMRYFKNNYGPIRDEQGRIIGLAVVAADITSMVSAEVKLSQSQEQSKLLISKMKQGLALHELILDSQGKPIDYRFLDVNDAFCELTGLSKSIIGKTLYEVLPQSEASWLKIYSTVALSGKPAEFEDYSKELGRYYHISAYSTTHMQFATLITDISMRMLLMKQLEESERKLRNAIEEAPIAILMHADDGEVLQINQTWTEISGYTKKDLVRLEDWLLKAYGKVPSNLERYRTEYFKDRHRRLDGEFIIHTKDGKKRHWEIYSAIIGKMDDGRKIAMNVAFDITERKQQNEEILYLSYHDSLTGLYNRRYYDQALWTLRHPQHLPLSVIMADINGLKLTNDAFGHSSGDSLLLRVRDLFLKVKREKDIISRIGGDEFVFLLPNTPHKEALHLIDDLNNELERLVLNGISISVSFGLSTAHLASEIEETIKQAEIDMYNKKLYELSSKRSDTIKAIIQALYLKNPIEEIHAKGVSDYAAALGQLLNMRKDDINYLRMMGNLHDIGKIAIDEYILNKLDPLTDAEWVEIKKHPESGYRILSSSIEYAEIANDILYHHEWFNGTGYPTGIEGYKIPLRSRIIAIADAYEAMTSDRPYRKAMSKSEATKELIRGAGTQFDLKLVQKFVVGYLKEPWTI